MQAMTKAELIEWLNNPIADELIGDDEPLLLLRADSLLYPQYDLHDDVRRFSALEQVRKWLGRRAFEELQTDNGAPEVRAHWRKLVLEVIASKDRVQ